MIRKMWVPAALLVWAVTAVVDAAPSAGAVRELEGGWEYLFTARESGAPPAGTWSALELPGDLGRLSPSSVGYFWLRRSIVLTGEPQALLMGPLGMADRILVDSTFVGETGTTRAGFRAPAAFAWSG